MKHTSIRSKLITLLYIIIIGLYLVMIAVTTPATRKIIETNNELSMKMLSTEKITDLNSHMKSVERAVNILEKYIYESLDFERMKTDSDYTNSFMDRMTLHAIDAALCAENVTTVYFRPDPNVYGSQSGIFIINDNYGNFIRTTPTDILKYPSTDREHVAWFYEPKQKGTPLWMEPYSNMNINVYMISYVIPLYNKHGEFVGVVGMDMSMAAIHKVVDTINYYDGFGFILNSSGSIIYHPEYPEGLSSLMFTDELLTVSECITSNSIGLNKVFKYKWHNKTHYAIGNLMQNDMYLVISAPMSEIMEPDYRMKLNMTILFFIALIALFISIRVVMHHIVHPIAELTQAASRISKGELNTDIHYSSNDEIGQLADSVRRMSSELQEYLSYIYKQAYTDAMTEVGNKAAYMDYIKHLELKIHEGMADFLLIIFDVNGLKKINDTLGHEVGDILISNAGTVLKKAFGEEHIYRIGGDEFIVIRENTSEEEVNNLFANYRKCLSEFNEKEHEYGKELSISFGHAFFKQGEDYKTVFQNADEAMYRNKEAFYSGKNDRRRSER